jgi:hypothetical protein
LGWTAAKNVEIKLKLQTNVVKAAKNQGKRA